MKKKINKREFLFIVLCFFIIIVAKIIRYTLMKETLVNYARGDDILSLMLSNTKLHFSISGNFNNAAIFFKIINIFNLKTYKEWEIYISIIWNIITFSIIFKLSKEKSRKDRLFIIATLSVLNIFCFTISKDPIQYLYFYSIYLVLCTSWSQKIKFATSIFILLLTAITFRSYYILIAFFTVIIYFLLNILLTKVKKIKAKHILAVLIIFGFVYFVFMNLSKLYFPSDYNEMLRVRRDHFSANTSILSIIPGSKNNLILFTLDYLLVVIRLLFPIELLAKGPLQWIFIIYQLFMTSYLVKALKNYKTNTEEQNIALCIYLGFILGSATFEPDFGSWIRHQAVVLPIIIFMIGLKKSKKSKLESS